MNRDYYHDHGDDILVVGAVGWIDGSWGDIYNTRSRYYKQRYNDFSMIKGYAKLGKEYGKADKRSIEKLLRNSATTKIVMTHFLPSPDCIEMKYMGDTLNHCYANSWGYLADSLGVDVWLYGHSHQKRSFSIGSTKFITNAIGYPSEPNSDIKVHIIEV
jgi:predicted phosphodiesterase